MFFFLIAAGNPKISLRSDLVLAPSYPTRRFNDEISTSSKKKESVDGLFLVFTFCLAHKKIEKRDAAFHVETEIRLQIA